VIVIYFPQSFACGKSSNRKLYGIQLIHANLRATSIWLNRAIYTLKNAPTRVASGSKSAKQGKRGESLKGTE